MGIIRGWTPTSIRRLDLVGAVMSSWLSFL
jgi:hypothetical protein